MRQRNRQLIAMRAAWRKVTRARSAHPVVSGAIGLAIAAIVLAHLDSKIRTGVAAIALTALIFRGYATASVALSFTIPLLARLYVVAGSMLIGEIFAALAALYKNGTVAHRRDRNAPPYGWALTGQTALIAYSALFSPTSANLLTGWLPGALCAVLLFHRLTREAPAETGVVKSRAFKRGTANAQPPVPQKPLDTAVEPGIQPAS